MREVRPLSVSNIRKRLRALHGRDGAIKTRACDSMPLPIALSNDNVMLPEMKMLPTTTLPDWLTPRMYQAISQERFGGTGARAGSGQSRQTDVGHHANLRIHHALSPSI